MDSPQLEIHNSVFSSFFPAQAPQTSIICRIFCGLEKIYSMPFVFHQSPANATWQTHFFSNIHVFKIHWKQYCKPLTTYMSSAVSVCTCHSHPSPTAKEQSVKLRARRNRVHMLWVAVANTCIITELNNLRTECTTSILTKEKAHQLLVRFQTRVRWTVYYRAH